MTNFLKNVAFGAVGGVVGTAAMQLYWNAATALAGEDPRSWTKEDAPHTLDEMALAGQHHEEGESSTAAVGRTTYEVATGEEPPEETKTALSQTVHWGYGTTMGGVYGALRGQRDGLDTSGGLAFGTALWALGDELMVPLLGLSKGPTAFPLAQHLHRLGAHLAYGLAAAAATQGGHALLGGREEPATWRGLAWKGAKTYLKWRAVKAVGRQGLKLFR